MGARSFFKGLSWLLALNLLIKPAWLFIIDRRVQNIVGHDAYGAYFALQNLSYVLLFLSDAGLSNLLAQRLSARESLNVPQMLKLKFFLLLLYTLGCMAIGALTGITQWNILLLLIFYQVLNTSYLFLRRLLTAGQLFKTDAFFSVLDKSLLLLLCLGPVYGLFFPITIPLFLQLQIASTTLATGVLLFVLIKKKAFQRGEMLPLKTVVRWLLPFAQIILLMTALNRLDAFLLERLRPDGAAQAGIYAMAYRLLDAGNMVGYLVATFLVPFVARHQTDTPLVQRVLLMVRHLLLFVSAGTVAVVLVFAPWLQNLLYHTTDSESTRVLRLCMAALPAYFLIHVYSSALTATTQFKTMIHIFLVSVVVNALLNLWLIPLYGAAGCCLAALVSQYGCALALWLAATQQLKIAAGAGSALLYPAAVFGLFLLLQAGHTLTNNVWIILSSIAAVALVLLLAARSRLKKLLLLLYK